MGVGVMKKLRWGESPAKDNFLVVEIETENEREGERVRDKEKAERKKT